jgi:hypothetical protein
MTDFQSAFDTNTRGINTTLTTQLSSVQQWANIPGSLVKASSSAAGYLWGFNSVNLVYVCQQPCTGQWQMVDTKKLAPPQPSSLGYMSGPWISGNIPITTTDVDDKGSTVYISFESPYTKMIRSDGVSKYYVGPISNYSSAKWTTYSSTPSGVYKLTLNPTQNSPAVTILDIATDETNVYLLFVTGSSTSIASKTANNQTEWSVLQASTPQFTPTNLFSTHTYLWLQTTTNQKAKIPKPINMTNSMPVSDTSVKITSSSSTALYGIDASGKAMKTDETLQTGWAPVSGLSGTPVKSVIGDLDQTGLFTLTDAGVSECVGDCATNKILPVNTQGYLPLYLTGDPSTKQLWMTSSTAGGVGNIFNRVASPDYSTILNAVTPLDKNRDTVVTDVKKDYTKQTEVMTVNQHLGLFKSLFTQLFGEATKAQADANTRISEVESDVLKKKADIEQLGHMQPTLQKFVVTLAVAALAYAILSPFGWIAHAIVLVLLSVGFYLSLNNDVNLSRLWTRLP